MMRLWKDHGATRIVAILALACLVIAGAIAAYVLIPQRQVTYSDQFVSLTGDASSVATTSNASADASTTPAFVVTHVETPTPLKAIYMTSWAAGSEKFRKELYDIVDTTEINAVVIDVKDYTGRISFPVNDPELAKIGASQNRIPDIQQFIAKLHEKGVYVIGRISSFQDSYLINIHPEWAVHTKEGKVWADYKGVKWLDAGAKPVYDYLVSIGKESYADGFDELNFDYIRYPSDGNLEDIAYSWSEGRPREEVLKGFFRYLHDQFSPLHIPISADLFGLTTSAEDDMGIGQILTDALPQFDYVAPMVYPSHFAKGYLGYPKPAQHPYEVIKYSMGSAVERAEATSTRIKIFGDEPIASTTPQLYSKIAVDKNKLRPWLQAFDLGAIYTPDMVRAQIQATYDLGLTSWMLWDAGSVYNKDALLPKNGSRRATASGTSGFSGMGSAAGIGGPAGGSGGAASSQGSSTDKTLQ